MNAMERQESETERRRILVVANETAGGSMLVEAVRFRARGERAVDVLVVAPALNSRLKHWLSDEGDARRAAEARLGRHVHRLQEAGIPAHGWVGDADPLQAIEDALHLFAADELIIATQAEDRSNWLARKVVERARARYPLPIAHLVVDPALDHGSLVATSRLPQDGARSEKAAA